LDGARKRRFYRRRKDESNASAPKVPVDPGGEALGGGGGELPSTVHNK